MKLTHALLPLLLACCWGCQEGCVLDDDVRFFAGDGARDCGTAAADGRAAVDGCVVEAFESGQAFIARYESVGASSQVVSVVASNTEGKVKLFRWDSAPCGGMGCEAVTDVQSCEGPALVEQSSEDPLASPIRCEELGLAQRVCG